MSAPAVTPMFRQYRSHKEQHPDAILLFRMGDFYEMFYEDAKQASQLLDLTLTARGRGTDSVVPMCGFPHHQLDQYTVRLVNANRRVAICEQVEDPRRAKGLVKREVVRVVTPGTLNDPLHLEPKANVWIAALASAGGRRGVAFLDVSTGEFLAWDADDRTDDATSALAARLREFAPREIVHACGFPAEELAALVPAGAVLTAGDAWDFTAEAATTCLGRQFGVASLEGYGFRDRPAAAAAAGGLLHYVQDTQRSGLEHLDGVRLYEPASHVLLDPATQRNLELERAGRDGGRQGSLFSALDLTLTSAGGRLLRRWLLAPLVDPGPITERHDAVGELVQRADVRQALRAGLDGVLDIERLVARTVARQCAPRELLALRASLERMPALLGTGRTLEAALPARACATLDPCADVAELIGAGIQDEPAATLREGGVIRDGHDAALDELRSIRRDGRAYLAALEAEERRATGIASLKVRFNRVFGYSIEVSRANLAAVPAHYQRKQTIAGGERFITPELKEHEARILTAQERIVELEGELYATLCERIAAQAPRLKAIAAAAALLDLLAAFAETAALRGYCRPGMRLDGVLRIVGGRHPVVERNVSDARFVPNATDLEAGARAIAILTGPNMGGKSTYLRQVALIVLMAQAGSFVPAESAEIGVVDRIFCRVGASDNLAEGQSTFMVEMTETANILRHASARSLLLLDEIGRGTSTFDGLAIAWAVVEHLDALRGGAPRTLFATHYHELTELEGLRRSVVNLQMAVRETGDRVVFCHRVESGAADRSYGIHVARLAGVPRPVVERAQEILETLESDASRPRPGPKARRGAGRPQPGLFPGFDRTPAVKTPDPEALAVLAELKVSDPERLTPIEALQLLAAWRRRLERD